jgi:hypothetical protein
MRCRAFSNRSLRQPDAARWRTGQSGAGFGLPRHEQPLVVAVNLHYDLYGRSAVIKHTASEPAPTIPGERRQRAAKPHRHDLGDGAGLQHHSGPDFPRPACRRPAGSCRCIPNCRTSAFRSFTAPVKPLIAAIRKPRPNSAKSCACRPFWLRSDPAASNQNQTAELQHNAATCPAGLPLRTGWWFLPHLPDQPAI